ncbi:hypothetical protein [Paenibacillus larvae]|uniref:hypothetical protein n=1 Tax=Paenibacillus larvae TaxID=1464 RepID=UPI00288F6960|nr:hypothetical protein [Paenibacillus larvae]MDT2277866.1 hypothetical protein [Paenibacillus larvae]
MTAIEKAIADMVATQVAEAEKRILERLSIPEDKTLTFSEACEHLQVSEHILRQLCREKRIPHRVIGSEGKAGSQSICLARLVWIDGSASKRNGIIKLNKTVQERET